MEKAATQSLSSDSTAHKGTVEKKNIQSGAGQYQNNLNLQLDTGEEYTRFRRRFYQIWYVSQDRCLSHSLINVNFRLPKDPPPPAPTSLADAPVRILTTYFQILG